MQNLRRELSDISRTNQLQLLGDCDDIAEKLYQYLRKNGKGIDLFPTSVIKPNTVSQKDYYRERDPLIREEVKKRLLATGKPITSNDIQYFLAESENGSYVFFLTSNTRHSGWIDLFRANVKNREKILNLCFKLYLMGQMLPFETINGFEELLIYHSQYDDKKKTDISHVWGQSISVHYNKHGVVSLYLSRQKRSFQRKDFRTMDADELGEIVITRGNKRYVFSGKGDGRDKNFIDFMRFDDKFQSSQLYYYQRLKTDLETFLSECEIGFTLQDFQANAYLEDHFVDQESLSAATAFDRLAIINNTGANFLPAEMDFLRNFFIQHGVSQVEFGFDGQTVNEYEMIPGETETDHLWKISTIIPWSTVRLHPDWNYLVINKSLHEDSGSMAFQRKDGLWEPSSEIDDLDDVDFYSDLKRRFTFVSSGTFFCMQGVNVEKFIPIKASDDDTMAVMRCPKKLDENSIAAAAYPFTDGLYLDTSQNILYFLSRQTDKDEWHQFCSKEGISVTSEYKKILSEMGIKSWIRASTRSNAIGLPIEGQAFSEQSFWAIYVKSPRYKDTKAVAVRYLFQNECIHIKEILTDTSQIRDRFPFLRSSQRKTQTGENKLLNGQEYLADEDAEISINCYTSNAFTPILIGRPQLLEDVAAGNIKINRTTMGDEGSRVLPLVMFYNRDTKPVRLIQDRVCLDLKQTEYIQYFVPPHQGLQEKTKRAFRVYHLYGITYQGSKLSTEQLVNNPIVALHFSTLTQNILRIGENSQASLLQKVAKVLVEN